MRCGVAVRRRARERAICFIQTPFGAIFPDFSDSSIVNTSWSPEFLQS
jgi:hypothetical protein